MMIGMMIKQIHYHINTNNDNNDNKVVGPTAQRALRLLQWFQPQALADKCIGSSGMWRLRMCSLKTNSLSTLRFNTMPCRHMPSLAGFENHVLLTLKTEGVGTSHLKPIWVRGWNLCTSGPSPRGLREAGPVPPGIIIHSCVIRRVTIVYDIIVSCNTFYSCDVYIHLVSDVYIVMPYIV